MYDSMSHCTPGYWFQYQVPPNSAPVSIIRMLSTPNWAQSSAGQKPAEPGADDDHVHLVGQRFTGDPGLRRVVQVPGELPVHGDVLVVAFGPQALVPLLPVLLPEGVGVEFHFSH